MFLADRRSVRVPQQVGGSSMTRVIGAPRSRRRRWTFMWCLIAMVTLGIVFIPGALAVHDTGAFELDGNATTSSSNDWDRVCHQATNNAGCGTTSDTTGATSVSWT